MTEILLTHCNHIFFDGKQARKMQPYPPLQTLIAAACLRADGFEVALFDTTLKAPEQGFRKVNTPLFAAPGTTVNTATFGVVTAVECAPACPIGIEDSFLITSR